MSENFKIIILAIFDQDDFPNKAMADIHGKPMIQHVFESAKDSTASEIVIATDSTRVGMTAEEFGATVCMMVDDDLMGLSRLAEVADKMKWSDDTIIVNFPGDAPLTPSSIIQQVADNLSMQTEADCAILYSMVAHDVAEKNTTINLIVDSNEHVIYMSRRPIPHQVSETYMISEYKCYIEINAYRTGLLRIYRNLPESELDWAENIEELKLLYSGMKINADEANSLIGQRAISADDIEKIKTQIAPTR
ncbi:3-deoxy-manno-octulosonate cytidylyltransferase [hydrothermal vent metagenome]|uniref:3-deoxy-manno-octulosonate cytidylyltransferase n=1 Tax=hydrothermal vent metagenome TaxID=652676 RepID=A0A3B0WLC3_9ZZZZ